MGSRDPEELCNTETEEGTVALQKKRLRRVSFAAEITSVHVFDRDEEYETPPDSSNPNHPGDDALGFLLKQPFDSDDSRDFSPNDDEDGASDDDAVGFLRPMHSPSPGGSTIGSSGATSNDEDNFFGPVSASFIRPNKILDSAASDENHDITMDSTAFSMHFRSLARSDSGGDASRTPTAVRLAFEEKTPTKSTASASSRSSMVLTGSKKPIPSSSVPAGNVKDSNNSNDMSLIGENPHRFDYGRISPRLDAILTEGSNALQTDSFPNEADGSPNLKIGGSLDAYIRGTMNSGEDRLIDTTNSDTIGKALSASATRMSKQGDDPVANPSGPIAHGCLSNASDAPADVQRTPNMSGKVRPSEESQESIKDKLNRVRSRMVSAVDDGSYVPYVDDKVLQIGLKEQPGNGNLSSTKGFIRQSTPNVLRHITNANQNMIQKEDFPPQGSVFIQSAETPELRDTGFSSMYRGKVTSLEQQSSAAFKEQETYGETGYHIQERVSEVKHFMVTPSTSACKDWALYNEKSANDTSKHVQTVSLTSSDKCMLIPQKSGELTTSAKRGGILKHIDLKKTRECTDRVNMPLGSCSEDGLMKATAFLQHGTVSGSEFPLAEVGNLSHGSLRSSRRDSHLIVTGCKLDDYGAGTPYRFASSIKRNLFLPSSFHESPSRDFQNQYQNGSLVNGRFGDLVATGAVESPVPVGKLDILSSGGMNYHEAFAWKGSRDAKQVGLHDLRDAFTASEIFQTPVRRSASELNIQSLSKQSNYSRNSFVGKGLSSTSSQPRPYDPHQGINVLRTGVAMPDFDNSAGRKRSGEEMSHTIEIAKTHSSSKRLKDGWNDARSLSARKSKNWNGIFLNMLGSQKQLFPSSTQDLNLRKISVLEDIVAHVQKAKVYESHSSVYQAQKLSTPGNDATNRRIAEAKLLLNGVAYERGKVQLLSLKRDRLLERISLLGSGIKKSQMFKLKFSRLPYLTVAAGFQTDGKYIQQCLSNVKYNNQLQHADVSAKQLELEASQREVKRVMSLFPTPFEIKEDQGNVNNAVLASNHLKRRMCCRLICQDLQLWKVDNLKSGNGLYSIGLEYQGLILQRLTLNNGCISSTNELCNTSILKRFPNMEALTAFAFLLTAAFPQRYVGPRSLAEVTQVTSLHVSNLLDVVEEVQLAQLEFGNLIRTIFHSPKVGSLHLELRLIDWKSGRRVDLALDLSNLKRGVYPADILPFQVQVSVAGSEESQLLSAEIKSTLRVLKAGSARVLRLCRCVSGVVEDPSRS